jgi:hypothetical protein
MQPRIQTVSDIIGQWPSAEAFSSDLGLKHLSHSRVMKVRGRIPRQHWPRVVEAAKARGLPVTEEVLKAAHVQSSDEIANAS